MFALISKSRFAASLRDLHENEEGSLTIESVLSVALAGGIMYLVWKMFKDSGSGFISSLISTIVDWGKKAVFGQ